MLACIAKNRNVLNDANENKHSRAAKYLHFSLVTAGHKIYRLKNSKCSHAGQRFVCGGDRYASSHAEMNALKALPYQKLSNRRFCASVTVYVVRFEVDATGELVLSNSKPCGQCLLVLHSLNIPRVVYSESQSLGLTSARVSDLINSKDFKFSSGYGR